MATADARNNLVGSGVGSDGYSVPKRPRHHNTTFQDECCLFSSEGVSVEWIAEHTGKSEDEVRAAIKTGSTEWRAYVLWVRYDVASRKKIARSPHRRIGGLIRRPLARRPRTRGAGAPARRSTASRSTAGGESGDSDLAGGDPPRSSAAPAAASKRARFVEVAAPPCARTVPSTPATVAQTPAAVVGCGGSR